jgi:site-specific DNA-methyltransferase (adenine-specific)
MFELNKVYLADCKDFIPQLIAYGVEVDLIYIDPPFGFKADEKFGLPSWSKVVRERKYNLIEVFPCDDYTKNYLEWLYNRLVLMRELLSEQGSIYVHLDWHVGHYVKLCLDEIFGRENFRNEIIWSYKSGGAGSKGYSKKHDTIHYYTKSSNFIFNPSKTKSYMAPGSGDNPAQTYYHDENGKYTLVNVKDWWDDIGILATSSYERVGYATQKPESLLERIIKASSNENSIVADFFNGSGTTAAVAEKLGRRWIASDINKKAVDIATKRINDIRCI